MSCCNTTHTSHITLRHNPSTHTTPPYHTTNLVTKPHHTLHATHITPTTPTSHITHIHLTYTSHIYISHTPSHTTHITPYHITLHTSHPPHTTSHHTPHYTHQNPPHHITLHTAHLITSHYTHHTTHIKPTNTTSHLITSHYIHHTHHIPHHTTHITPHHITLNDENLGDRGRLQAQSVSPNHCTYMYMSESEDCFLTRRKSHMHMYNTCLLMTNVPDVIYSLSNASDQCHHIVCPKLMLQSDGFHVPLFHHTPAPIHNSSFNSGVMFSNN